MVYREIRAGPASRGRWVRLGVVGHAVLPAQLECQALRETQDLVEILVRLVMMVLRVRLANLGRAEVRGNLVAKAHREHPAR